MGPAAGVLPWKISDFGYPIGRLCPATVWPAVLADKGLICAMSAPSKIVGKHSLVAFAPHLSSPADASQVGHWIRRTEPVQMLEHRRLPISVVVPDYAVGMELLGNHSTLGAYLGVKDLQGKITQKVPVPSLLRMEDAILLNNCRATQLYYAVVGKAISIRSCHALIAEELQQRSAPYALNTGQQPLKALADVPPGMQVKNGCVVLQDGCMVNQQALCTCMRQAVAL